MALPSNVKHAALILVAALIALVLLVIVGVLSLGGCTVIHIEGDETTVTDAGGHGGGVAIQPRTLTPFGTPQAPPLDQRLSRRVELTRYLSVSVRLPYGLITLPEIVAF